MSTPAPTTPVVTTLSPTTTPPTTLSPPCEVVLDSIINYSISTHSIMDWE